MLIGNLKMNLILYIIRDTSNKKSPGVDFIDEKTLKNLPLKVIREVTIIFNAMLRVQYFPSMWKLSQIITILKPGKDSYLASSYGPISLLPTLSKIFDKIILTRLKLTIEKDNIILDHQFGFRRKHSTIEQVCT